MRNQRWLVIRTGLCTLSYWGRAYIAKYPSVVENDVYYCITLKKQKRRYVVEHIKARQRCCLKAFVTSWKCVPGLSLCSHLEGRGIVLPKPQRRINTVVRSVTDGKPPLRRYFAPHYKFSSEESLALNAEYASCRLDIPCFVTNKRAWRFYCWALCGGGEHSSKSRRAGKNTSAKTGLQMSSFSTRSSLVIK